MNNFVDLVILGCSFETFYYKKLSLILFLRLLIFLVAWFLGNLTIGGGGRPLYVMGATYVIHFCKFVSWQGLNVICRIERGVFV